jgi:hypothetical protein
MKRSQDHTQLTRLAAISLVLVMCLSALPMLAPPAAADGSLTNPSDYRRNVYNPGTYHDELLQWTLVTDAAPNLKRIVMVDGTIYATSKDGKFYSSSDYGESWDLLYDFGPAEANSEGMCLYYSEYWDRFFVSFERVGSPLYMSMDRGITWEISDRIPHNQYLLEGGMDESPDGVLYYGQYGNSGLGSNETWLEYHSYVRKSTDGGFTWTTETSIPAHHIHSVGVAHDGKLFASYGDRSKPPYTGGLMVKENGVWANVSSDIMMLGQPYNIKRIGGYTFFGSDGYDMPSIIRYDGARYEASLATPDPAGKFQYCIDMWPADGVIYAFTFNYNPSGVPGGPLYGHEIWASPDMGDSWYRIRSLIYDQGVVGPIVMSGATEDGCPYVFALSTSGTDLYRFNHLGQAGIQQLLHDRPLITDDGKYHASVILANSDYSIPLYTHGVRDPTITIRARNLTNIFPYGGFDDGSPWPLDIEVSDWEYDTTTYTTGPQSLRWTAGNFPTDGGFIDIVVTQSQQVGKRFTVVYDAKMHPDSSEFALMLNMRHSGANPQTEPQRGYVLLTDEWQTYSYTSTILGPTNNVNVWLRIMSENRGENKTAYIDNIRVFAHDEDEVWAIVPTGQHEAGVGVRTNNVVVSIDGTTYDLGGPYEDGEVIRTIQLSGDYRDIIDLSAYCDGAVEITIEGEAIDNGVLPAATYMWDGEGESMLASEIANWRRVSDWGAANNDVPFDLYPHVKWGPMSSKDCIWDLSRPVQSFTIDVGYQGKVTLSEGNALILRDGGSVSIAPGHSIPLLQIMSDDGRTASWAMTATGTVSPVVTGLESGVSYRWYLDGVEQGEVKADKDGTIALSYTSTGLHTIEVKPSSMTLAMDGLAATIGIVAVLAVLSGVLGMLGTAFGRIKF